MSLEVVDLDDPVEVGGELTYEVRVLNQGRAGCTNIQITATAPEGLRREGSGPTGYRVNGPQLIFDPLAKLATKADAVYRIRCGAEPGDYRFRVQMTCDQLRQPVVNLGAIVARVLSSCRKERKENSRGEMFAKGRHGD